MGGGSMLFRNTRGVLRLAPVRLFVRGICPWVALAIAVLIYFLGEHRVSFWLAITVALSGTGVLVWRWCRHEQT